MKEITRELFAEWSFLRDQTVGLYKKSMTWNDVVQEEKQSYLEEADYYLSKEKDNWPLDILERMG